MNKEYYAIEVIGYGKKARYAIKKVIDNGVYPVDGRAYKTLECAQAVAADMCVTIERTGDFYQII